MQQTLTIRIPGELKAELNAISRSEHLQISDLVRESLRTYVAARRFRQLRGKVLPFAEAQGLLTDEDVFNSL